jgi:SAM-dependent methyltransferase
MSEVRLREHSRRQRRYFERSPKPGMRPADTSYLRRHVQELIRFADIQPGERVLEVGCGMGRYTLPLARAGVRVEGLDLSPLLLERLKRFDGGRFGIPLHAVDILDAPAELERAFDVVVALFTMHHVHDLGATVRAMHGLVRPGGRVAFLEPNPYNPLYYLQILFTPGMTWEGDGGIVRMRRVPIFRALREAGFVHPESSRFGFFPPFLANRPWGGRLEAVLERVPLWRPMLPFLLVRAERR